MELKNWLDANGLGKYAELFAESEIDLEILPELSESDLNELGLPVGARRRLVIAIENLDRASRIRRSPDTIGAATGERRHASVLFSDLSGYTSMSERLDPEEVRDLMDRIKTEAVRIVEAHGGSVNQFVGDEILALFGIPNAHRDDAHRAVRAALEMHEMVRAVSPQAEASLGRPIRLHSGIATGLVVTHLADDRDGRVGITGDTVNVSARLKSAEADDAILVCTETQRALNGAFELQGLEDAQLKGKQKSIKPYRVVRASTSSHEYAIPFVGRRAELQQIRAAAEICVETGTGQVVVIRGDPGIGKTRLAREAEHSAAQQGFSCHRTEVLEIGGGSQTDPLRLLIKSILGIDADSQEDVLRITARDILASGFLDADGEPFLLDLLGLQLPTELRAKYDAMENAYRNQRKRLTAASLLRCAANDQPCFLLVEDVHWADSLALAQLATLAAATAECPALLVLTTRISGDPLDSHWRQSAGNCTLSTIDLNPLRPGDARTLAKSFSGVASQTAERCVERAAGNPLFLEQLLLNPAQAEGTTIPGSVQSLVLARVDLLPADDKTVLQAASVFGQRFQPDAVQNIVGMAAFDFGTLLKQGLIRKDDAGYMFAHALVCDGVYESLLHKTRRDYHGRAALWYEQRNKILYAEHLEAAGDQAAGPAFLAASRAEAEALHLDRALRLVERGEALVRSSESHCELLLEKGRLQRELGALKDSIRSYEEAVAAALDDTQRCLGLVGMAEAMRLSDDFERCLSVLAQAQPLGEVLERSDLRAQINFLRGCVYFATGRTNECLDTQQMTKIDAENSGSWEIRLRALGGLADGYYAVGRLRDSYRTHCECVNMSARHGLYRIEAANRVAKGWAQQYLEGSAPALEELRLALRQSQEVGSWRSAWLAKCMIGSVLINLHRLGEAELILAELEKNLAHMEAPRLIAISNDFLASFSFYRGETALAYSYAKRAQDIWESTRGAHSRLANLGIVILTSPDYESALDALSHGEKLLTESAAVHNHYDYWRFSIDAALRFARWGDALRFADNLGTSNSQENTEWANFFVRRGRALAKLGLGEDNTGLYQEVADTIDLGKRMGLLIALPELKDAADKLKRVRSF